ncbi:MAG: S8 family serine peptidase [Acidilobaceae archaeon]|nr:S8 family serine peptidase [Acidilobaceae archaeon]
MLRAMVFLFLLLLSIPASASAPLFPRPEAGDVGFTGRYIVIGASAEHARKAVESMGGKVIEEFRLIGGVAFEGSPRLAGELSKKGFLVAQERALRLIRPFSHPVQPFLAEGTPTVGAPFAWGLGLNGTGVKVAIIDTGIENDHPWLLRAGKSVVKWEVDATESGVVDYCGKGLMPSYEMPSYHGTHVAGIVASQNPEYPGVAPGVDLYDIIAFSPEYYCESTTETVLIKAVEVALLGPDGKPDSGDEADVISMSLGFYLTPELAYAVKTGQLKLPLLEAIERAARSKVVVVAAGNGWSLNFYNALCLANGVICVGAASHMGTQEPEDDMLAFFSSKGPALPGLMVPHVVAPGVFIYSSIPTEIGEADFLTGTSMSTPFVSGAAAILIQHFRQQGVEATPREVMAALMQTARDVRPQSAEALWLLPDWYKELISELIIEPPRITVADQGAGQIDLRSALRREVRVQLNGLPYAHLLASSGSMELRVTNLLNRSLSLRIGLDVSELYTFRDASSLFSAPQELSLSPRATASLRVTFKDLEPGTYGGYVLLQTNSSVYRFPFTVTSPVRLSTEGLRFYKSVDTSIATRDRFETVTLYVNVEEPLLEPVSTAIVTRAGSVGIPTLTITSPSGDFTSIFTGSGYIFSQRGTYIISLYLMYSLLGSPDNTNLSIVIGAPLLTRSVERSLETLQLLTARISLLESSLRSLNASLLAVRASLEAVRADLSREAEERRREVARIDQAIAALQSAARSLEEGLRAARVDLLAVGERLARANSTLAAAIAAEAERVTKLEGDARALQQALGALAQELNAVEEEVAEREKEVGELRGDHDLTRLLTLLSGLVAVIALALAGYLLRKRS